MHINGNESNTNTNTKSSKMSFFWGQMAKRNFLPLIKSQEWEKGALHKCHKISHKHLDLGLKMAKKTRLKETCKSVVFPNLAYLQTFLSICYSVAYFCIILSKQTNQVCQSEAKKLKEIENSLPSHIRKNYFILLRSLNLFNFS